MFLMSIIRCGKGSYLVSGKTCQLSGVLILFVIKVLTKAL